MKKSFIIIFILILTIVILSGCAKDTYVITATVYGKYKEPSYYKYLSKDLADLLIELDKEKIRDEIDSYIAKKIISFTDESVRFIDIQGQEQFITADKITIRLKDN